MLAGGVEIDPIDEFHEEITVRIVEVGQMGGVNVGDGKAQGAEKSELSGLTEKFAIDSMGGNLENGPGTILGHERERGVNATTLERFDLRKLRRRTGPVVNDTAEHLPGNVVLLVRHQS